MTELAGPGILAAIKQVRGFMSQVSKMLLEADSLMGQAGWEPRAGTTALSGSAYTIGYPRSWMPYQVFRFYRHPNIRTAIPCIAVLVESSDLSRQFSEPLISALLMQYDEGEPLPEGNGLYDIATWHLYAPDRKDDGSISHVVAREVWKNDTTAKMMLSFALPLVSIDSRLTLEKTVVTPLLQIIAEAYPRS